MNDNNWQKSSIFQFLLRLIDVTLGTIINRETFRRERAILIFFGRLFDQMVTLVIARIQKKHTPTNTSVFTAPLMFVLNRLPDHMRGDLIEECEELANEQGIRIAHRWCYAQVFHSLCSLLAGMLFRLRKRLLKIGK